MESIDDFYDSCDERPSSLDCAILKQEEKVFLQDQTAEFVRQYEREKLEKLRYRKRELIQKEHDAHIRRWIFFGLLFAWLSFVPCPNPITYLLNFPVVLFTWLSELLEPLNKPVKISDIAITPK